MVGLLRATGRRPSELWAAGAPAPRDVRLVVLTRPRADLYARIEARVDAELKRMAPQMKMPGFRPGKVPANLVRKMHGPALMQDALQGSIQRGVQTLLEEKQLRLAMLAHLQAHGAPLPSPHLRSSKGNP